MYSEKPSGGDEPQKHAGHGARRDPAERPVLHVRRHVVDVGEDEHRHGHGGGPADEAPDQCGGRPEAGEVQQVLGEAPAHEHEHERDEHEEHEHDGREDVDRLAPEEAAARGHLEHHVERAPCGFQHARGAVEGDDHADHQGRGRGRLALERVPQRGVERRDGRLGRHVAHVAQDRVVGRGVLPDEAEQRQAEQQPREQRHQRVVGERGRVVGHLVGAEGLQRPPGDADGPALHGATAGGTRPASAGRVGAPASVSLTRGRGPAPRAVTSAAGPGRSRR